MSLARKTLALFLLLGVSLWLGSYAILKIAIFPAFEELERESSEQALTRVTRILEEDLRAINILNIEYSVWSQTYEYALGERPGYEEENLDPAYWTSIDINLFAVYDPEGRELFSWIADADGNIGSFREELGFALEADHPLISFEDVDSAVQGFLRLKGGVMQVVSRPILTSEGEGPIAGTFIVGQALTPQRIADLSERATVDISVTSLDKQDATSDIAARIIDASKLGQPHFTRVGHDTIHSYAPLTDLSGVPIAVLETRMPRRISEIGISIVNTAMLALGLASAVFLIAGLYLLHVLVTKPVNRLTGQILGMRESGDLSVEVDEGRTDEVGTLAKEFALLIQRLGGFEATRQIRELEREQSHDPAPIIAQAATVEDNLASAPGCEVLTGEKTSEAQIGASRSSNSRVLVVEDNPVNQQVARSMLQSIGYESQCAENGDEALAAMAVEDFDLILMDCHMPVRDGYETTREIRRLEEATASRERTPIIAVTADFLESNRESCIDAGMDDYLMKPFTQRQLRAIANRWLDGSAANDPLEVRVDEDGFSQLGDTQTLACIDRDIFNEICELDSSDGDAIVREIVVSYCATSTKMMLQLRAAIVDGNLELIEMIAHSLKGGSGQLGATFLATLCEEMIRAAKDADKKRLAALLERAAMEHSAVLSALDVKTQTNAA